MPYYIQGRSGDRYDEATFHARRDCPDLEEPIRPIRESAVTDETDVCGACSPLASEPSDGSDGPTAASDDATGGPDETESDGEELVTAAELIEDGRCPWCDDYEGEHVAQHASSAHPDRWDEFNE